MSKGKMPVTIRPMNEQDRNFIFASWLKNYKNSSAFAKRIKHDVFFDKHHKIVEFILAKPTTRVLIANEPGDPKFILGYFVYEETGGVPVAHYCFVKSAFQTVGVGRALLEASKIDYRHMVFTHFTYSMDHILMKHEGPEYDPYRL